MPITSAEGYSSAMSLNTIRTLHCCIEGSLGICIHGPNPSAGANIEYFLRVLADGRLMQLVVQKEKGAVMPRNIVSSYIAQATSDDKSKYNISCPS
jgi:hypothetical protein